MASTDRWTGLRAGMQRAAPEIYWNIRQEGHANVREWWQAVWGNKGDSPEKSNTWHSACTLDLRIQELGTKGAQALAKGLATCDICEGLLRQLASSREFALSQDSEAAARILGFRMPGDSVTPTWLLDEARIASQAKYKESLRVRRPSGKTDGAPAKGKGKGRGGKADTTGKRA